MLLKKVEKDNLIKALYESSNILASIYDSTTGNLEIIFKAGTKYKYPNVSKTDYMRFEIADSQGAVFNTHIKKYTYEKLANVNTTLITEEFLGGDKNFKLKELPRIVYWLETKQFTIIDKEGNEREIRIGESSKNIEYWIWEEPGGWVEIEDMELMDWINEGLSEQEWVIENEKTKKIEEKMDELIDNYTKEKGEVKSFKEFDDLVSTISRANLFDRKDSYYEENYKIINYVKNKLKLK
jgi:hypothetical protein